MNDSIRIKFAYYHPTWVYEGGDQLLLKEQSESVVATDITEEMEEHIFCPECSTNLTKSPKHAQRFRNGRRSCFVHWPSYQDVSCSLRSSQPVGMRFETEELATQALDREDLVLINQFMTAPPMAPEGVGPYQQTPVEDLNGPVSNIPISRHGGQTFRLPTRISSVQMLCRNFDRNLHRYYQLPGRANPQPLFELLYPVTSITAEDAGPKLYYGRIQESFVNTQNPRPDNIRMTRLVSGNQIVDFYVKQRNGEQLQKGIDEEKIGQYIIFWSAITSNGVGLCAENMGWGEYALLPDRYTRLIEALVSE